MAKIREFMIVDSADPAAGIPAVEERVTVILHDDESVLDQDDETREDLRRAIGEIADAPCIPFEEYRAKERAAIEAEAAEEYFRLVDDFNKRG